MTESTSDNQNHEMSSSDKFIGSALDKAFPSPILIGAVIFLVIVLTLYNGIKVVNIDRQELEITNERKILMNEKKRHDEIKIALPKLEQEIRRLEAERIDLLSKVTAEQNRYEDLADKISSATDQLTKANAEYSEARSNTDSARKVYADLTNKNLDARSQLSRNENEVEIAKRRGESLSAQTEQLEAKIKDLNSDISSLNAKITELNITNERLSSQKQSLIKELEQYASDRGKLIELTRNVDSLMVILENAAKKAGIAVQRLDSESANLSRATVNITAETEKISEISRNIETRNSDLINTTQKLDSSAGPLQNISDSINKQVIRLATAADDTVRLKTIISDLEQMVQIFRVDLNGLNTTMTQINELTSKFESWTESIPAIQRSFSEPLNDLQSTMSNSKSQIETKSEELMISLTDVKNKINPISEQLSVLAKDLQSFRNFIEAINHTPAVKD